MKSLELLQKLEKEVTDFSFLATPPSYAKILKNWDAWNANHGHSMGAMAPSAIVSPAPAQAQVQAPLARSTQASRNAVRATVYTAKQLVAHAKKHHAKAAFHSKEARKALDAGNHALFQMHIQAGIRHMAATKVAHEGSKDDAAAKKHSSNFTSTSLGAQAFTDVSSKAAKNSAAMKTKLN